MAQRFGAALVLDMHRASAELDERARSAGDVEGAGAEARVDVHQEAARRRHR